MSDWQVGDLAVCIYDWPKARECGLFRGRVYRVAGLYTSRQGLGLGLILEGVLVPPSSNATNARRFRKIRPDEHTACETEFKTLLKRSTRKVEA